MMRCIDLFFAGSLKTLLPRLRFGRDEIFLVWVLIKTPENKSFPAKFYFGPSGTSWAGWTLQGYLKVFPSDFRSVINYSPFDLSDDELNSLVEAFELVFQKGTWL